MEDAQETRYKLSSKELLQSSVHARLLMVLDSVRRIASREALSAEQISRINALPADLIIFCLSLFTCAFSAAPGTGHSPALFSYAVVPAASLLQPPLAAEHTNAQFYIRFFPFDSADAAILVLRQVTEKKPQYHYRVESLISVLENIGKGAIAIPYGGLTIGNCPVGRAVDDDDDAEEPDSMMKTFISCYTGDCIVVNILPLSFATAGVIPARSDDRVDLYESLIIDSLGFCSLNTAPPGLVADYKVKERQMKLFEAVATMKITAI